MQKKDFKIEKYLSIGFVGLVFLFLANPVLAICEGPIVPCGLSQDDLRTLNTYENESCTLCHLFLLINNIIKFILTCLTPIVASLMLIVGGLYLLVAGPSPEKVTQAKGIITAAVVGIVIIFVAWVFLNTFLDAIGVAKWTGLRDNPETTEVEEGWWQIDCAPKPK